MSSPTTTYDAVRLTYGSSRVCWCPEWNPSSAIHVPVPSLSHVRSRPPLCRGRYGDSCIVRPPKTGSRESVNEYRAVARKESSRSAANSSVPCARTGASEFRIAIVAPVASLCTASRMQVSKSVKLISNGPEVPVTSALAYTARSGRTPANPLIRRTPTALVSSTYGEGALSPDAQEARAVRPGRSV